MNKKKTLTVFSNFDIRVVVAFCLLFVIGILFFLLKLDDYVDCDNAKFFIISDRFAVGEVIQFDVEVENAKDWEWDFGDDSPKEHRKQTLHKYTSAGIFTVSLVINGSCQLERQIEIKSLGEILNQARVPEIITPKNIQVGVPVQFKYKYKGEVFAWEWGFGESGRVDDTDGRPVYTFSSPGKKTVWLMLNGDAKHIAKQIVYVKPRDIVDEITDEEVIEGYVYEKDPVKFDLPPGDPKKDPLEEFLDKVPLNPPLKKKEELIKEKDKMALAPSISEEQFELLLLQVSKESKTKEDFASFVCEDFEIPVVKNGEKIISFAEFCKSIQGKEIRIDILRLTKDNLNCIDGFTIEYKIKKFFWWKKDND